MKNTSTSLFRQELNIIPKHEFEEIIMNHQADKHKQNFDSWSHFVSMIFCQLAQANSLREICGGLKTCGGKLNHPGVDRAPSKSSLSYANQHRDPKIFKDIFFMLLKHCQCLAPGHKFTFKKKRWQIESFFKMLKQYFKIKTFVGTSENAVKIQVWTALIAILLLKCLKFMSKAQWHFSTLMTFLKWNLFVYRDLQKWLDQPCTKPPDPISLQLEFDFRTA